MPLLLVLWSGAALAWPGDDAWQPVTRGGTPLADGCADVHQTGWWNISGTEAAPAAQTHLDDDHLWFRIRLADRPHSIHDDEGVSWRQIGVNVLIEEDWDPDGTSYDLLLYLDGAAEEVSLWANIEPADHFDADPPDTLLEAWPAPPTGDGAARFAETGTRLCTGNRDDWFVDLALPLDALESHLAADVDPTSLGFAFTTSSQPGDWTLDVAGCPAPDGTPCESWWEVVSDPLLEPAEAADTSDGAETHHEAEPGCGCASTPAPAGALLLAAAALIRRRGPGRQAIGRPGVTPPSP